MKILFAIVFILTALLDAAVLELGKNVIPGWIASVILLIGFLLLHREVLSERSIWLKLLSWLCLFVVLAVVFKLSGPPVRSIPAVSVKDPVQTGVVTVEQGDLSGVLNEDGSVEVYAGIPYAKPPVGDLRWKEPQEPEHWEGVRRCDTFAPMSMQQRTNTIFGSLTDIFVYHTFRVSLKDNFLEPMSEDSLYLNIWKPSGELKNAPVLFFIHGGSLTGGQPSYSEYNGESLAKRGIIVVNFGYRLNVFGYYADDELAKESPNGTTGNYGLLDQIQALKWGKENIAAFGGDPDNITIAGESAGASSVNAICVSPLSEGLFRRAIAESSGITAIRPYHTFRTLEAALDMGKKIREEFGAQSISDLRSVDAEKLVNTRYTNSAMTVDGYAITEQPYLTYERGANHEEALLNGFNTHEADLFMLFNQVSTENYEKTVSGVLGDWTKDAVALYPAQEVDPKYHYIVERGTDAKGSANKIYTAAWFSYSHYTWSRYLQFQERPVWEYYFSKDNGGLGSNHAGEMPYCFGNLFRHAGLYDKTDEALSDQMMEYWVNFIKTGDPNGEGLPEWEKFRSNDANVMGFGENTGMTTDPYADLYPLLDQYQQTQN
ncbi:MAG: carboxylesterase family protein [Oscillospiraceae bacterium]|nr:carboxylesterase family protein [Oscillospiraceae bacterium]